MYVELAILASFVFIYSLVAGRLEKTSISGPIIFVVVGLLLGPVGLGWFEGGSTRTELRVITDLTLALILFIDAAKCGYDRPKAPVEDPGENVAARPSRRHCPGLRPLRW